MKQKEWRAVHGDHDGDEIGPRTRQSGDIAMP